MFYHLRSPSKVLWFSNQNKEQDVIVFQVAFYHDSLAVAGHLHPIEEKNIKQFIFSIYLPIA